MKNNQKNYLYNFLLILFTLSCVFAGFYLPGYILNKKTEAQMNQVSIAPEEYYLSSATVMARNASEKLSSLDKINLITGKWESTMTECDSAEAFLTEIEAVELAISQMEYFYQRRVYPVSLNSNYANWYSWSTKVYKYTDNSFNTYTAYLWVITFSKYDSDIIHQVCITEDGVVLNAQTNMPLGDMNINDIRTAYNSYAIANIYQNSDVKLIETVDGNSSSHLSSPCPEINIDDISFDAIYYVTISEGYQEPSSYQIYQYEEDSVYGIGLTSKP